MGRPIEANSSERIVMAEMSAAWVCTTSNKWWWMAQHNLCVDMFATNDTLAPISWHVIVFNEAFSISLN